jgi:hypothetical protein
VSVPIVRSTLVFAVALLMTIFFLSASASATPATASTSSTSSFPPAVTGSLTPRAYGELDCNGLSPIQHPVHPPNACTDIRGFPGAGNQNTWGGRFYDNGAYIGHDEPDMTFLSSQPGSGNDVTWTETLGSDPSAAPTVSTPGKDVSHWFELSIAPWFSMMMCDGNSYPQLPCTPESDANAPTCIVFCSAGEYPGAGAAFMEMQFYPPGFAPFSDSISCDNTHWCAALTIDSLECTYGFVTCNANCIEPVNFAFLATNGVPAGPPSPQLANLATFTPNSHTLLMNPGDRITVHLFDAPVPGGGNAFKVVVKDLTTGQSGFMQASAANGFAQTSITDCSGTPFNFQPEYNTAARTNIAPWSALQTDISTEFEIGHFTPCTSVSDRSLLRLAPGVTDLFWKVCNGPYEATAPGGDGGTEPEVSDALCYPSGDTHGIQKSAPDTTTGCLNDLFQNGDLDFDGSPYWTEWPTGASATSLYPASFLQALPTTHGHQYSQFFVQTDVALSESTCSEPSGSGCAVPPPNAPGLFYPYWSRVASGACTIEFGDVASGPGVNNLGQDAQYGTDQFAQLGYSEFEGPVLVNTCS